MAELQVDDQDGIRVLIAGDEPLIAQLIMVTLDEDGIDSTIALSGRDAVQIIAADPTGFQLLVTDIRMGPPPDGWSVADAARIANPDIGVIYITGDSMAEWPLRGVSESLLLEKPFEPEGTRSAVAKSAGMA